MDGETLAQRLLQLRQQHWGELITQPTLGRLLGVKAPTISSWERAEAVPPQERLVTYATLFASRRSLDTGRLLHADELSETERGERDTLLRDLGALRQQGLGRTDTGDPDPLLFDGEAPIRIICGRLDDPPKTARGSLPNYMVMSAYADLDALVELYGHIRARNPHADVRHKLAQRLEGHDLHAHLVLLGNLAWQQTDLRHLLSAFPVQEVEDDRVHDGEVFELSASKERFLPTFADPESARRVIEDVGLIARTTNPVDSAFTLTVCSGVYTRGVYGAVRSLTDVSVRAANAGVHQ